MEKTVITVYLPSYFPMRDVDGCNIVKYFDALRPKESFFLPNYNNILDVDITRIQTQKIPNLFTATIPKNNHAFRLEVS